MFFKLYVGRYYCLFQIILTVKCEQFIYYLLNKIAMNGRESQGINKFKINLRKYIIQKRKNAESS